MKKILALVLALGLAGCAADVAKFKAAYDVVTSSSVSPTMVYVAANTFDALEATATNYLKLPKCGGSANICRNQAAVVKIIPAVRAGRVARNNLEQFLKDHPGQLGPQGLYDSLTASITTLQTIYSTYNVTKVN